MENIQLEQLESYDYFLPKRLIAQNPVTRRDSSRLLFVSRKDQKLEDHRFYELPQLLQPGDRILINETKVLPARLNSDAGEILLVRPAGERCWDALIYPGKNFKPGKKFQLDSGISGTVISQSTIGRIIRIDAEVDAVLAKQGKMPLPPYIEREANAQDVKRYQTIYAKHSGSVAAPTAGLHFTRRVFEKLHRRGISVSRITLHVGPGTFRPVKNSNITQHRIDPEFYSCSKATWNHIRSASRVIAVGTTTTRALETIALTGELEGYSNLFIYPGHRFGIVGGLITNFHLPRSSLLMLVSAFGGYSLVRTAYEHAIREAYRFYSYGDAMMLL